MTKCPRCYELELEIKRLRALVRPVDAMPDAASIRDALKVSPSEAWILKTLYDAGGQFVKYVDLDREIAVAMSREYIVGQHIGNLIWRIRNKMGGDFIEASRGNGYRLSESGHHVIDQIVKGSLRDQD